MRGKDSDEISMVFAYLKLTLNKSSKDCHLFYLDLLALIDTGFEILPDHNLLSGTGNNRLTGAIAGANKL